MSTRLDYIKYDDHTVNLQNKFKENFKIIEDLLNSMPVQCRESNLALIKLEETWMWIGKYLKVYQETRDKQQQG